MKTIYFVRHCQAEGQHKDSPLTKEGLLQAEQLADFFRGQDISIDQIISSPFLRATDSIRPFAEQAGISIKLDDRLGERILSEEPVDDWLDVLEESFNHPDFCLPGGESANDVLNRMNPLLDTVLEQPNIQHTILVTHGNWLAILLQQYDSNFGFAEWKNLTNPDVYKVEYHPQQDIVASHVWQR
ncbi:histidine phosphatase family protein [Ornithinibacillus gellani]|uniref:histidine phosphatase family protein n=1 Tax=Ornithinibacillus gellani TaxID=2293253 RepID=UPI000F463FF1|nr:histidine phosphatase family protein [Ornithinibacillus gellani]TQS74358.1 histidine phosphatase family protein [Ornithinibacillus gellani]